MTPISSISTPDIGAIQWKAFIIGAMERCGRRGPKHKATFGFDFDQLG